MDLHYDPKRAVVRAQVVAVCAPVFTAAAGEREKARLPPFSVVSGKEEEKIWQLCENDAKLRPIWSPSGEARR